MIMLDYLRNLRKPVKEKQQEALNAYLDDTLTPQQRRQVEKALAADAELRVELDQLRAIKQMMRQLPQRRARRNFTLDPALYGRPRREPLIQAYPVLRTATVLTAFIFVFVIAANIFLGGVSNLAPGAAEPLAMVAESAAETAIEEKAVAVEEAVENESELAFATEMLPEMTAEAPAAEEAAPLLESEQAADEASAGEQEMPAEALVAPDLNDAEALIMPQATPAAEDQIRQAVPADAETREEDALLATPAIGPTALASEVAQQLDAQGESAQIPTEVEKEQASQFEAPAPAPLRPFGGLSLIILLLGIVLAILLLLTLTARRRLNK